jgi:hypothetical protein
MIATVLPYALGAAVGATPFIATTVIYFRGSMAWRKIAHGAEFDLMICNGGNTQILGQLDRANALVAKLTEERTTLLDRIETLHTRLKPFTVKHPRDDKGRYLSLKSKHVDAGVGA